MSQTNAEWSRTGCGPDRSRPTNHAVPLGPTIYDVHTPQKKGGSRHFRTDSIDFAGKEGGVGQKIPKHGGWHIWKPLIHRTNDAAGGWVKAAKQREPFLWQQNAPT